MYLGRPQLHADISLKRTWERFHPRSGYYSPVCASKRKVQERRISARSYRSVQDLVPRTRPQSCRDLFTERTSRASADRDGCGPWKNIRVYEKGIEISSCCSQHSFTNGAVKSRLGGISFRREIHRRRRRDKMALTGAARKKYYFQFITTPTSDTSGTTLLLHFDGKRYLFGHVSEGTQRACMERGVGLKNVRDIFLTGHVKWSNTGGLIGMILTVADSQAAEREAEKLRSANTATPPDGPRRSEASVPSSRPVGEESLTIHGGEHLLHTVACARRFVFRKGMPISINEFEHSSEVNLEEPTWKDENVRIWAMSIPPSGYGADNLDGMGSLDAIASSPEESPGSSRGKRKHHVFAREDDESISPASPGQHLRDQALRQSIISDMFNSEWDRDALFETSLPDVKMPAALFVRDPLTKKITRYSGPRPGEEEPLPDIKVLVRDPWPGARFDRIPPARDIGFKPAISYIIQGYPQRGRFDMQKANSLRVPRGPLYRSLTEGKSVTLKDGTVITPEMVLGPTKPARGIAIVDLPSKQYVSNLVSRPEWTSEQTKNGIAAICWILGPGVASDDELKNFMESMRGVEHVISSPDTCPNYLAFDASASSAIRLSRIHRDIFPVPIHDNVTVPQLGARKVIEHVAITESGARTGRQVSRLLTPTAAKRGLLIQMEPNFCISQDHTPPFLNTADVVQSLPENVRHSARLAHEKVAAETDSPNGADSADRLERSGFDPEIITLGTGSALPSKYRNVSATLLRTGKYGDFLFDCGENTMGQLRRIFDPTSLRDVLRNLKFIWISHLHADHHLGTVSVLAAQALASSDDACERREQSIHKAYVHRPTVVAAEDKMHKFLQDYGSVERFAKVHAVLCGTEAGPDVDKDFWRRRLGIWDLQTTKVDHCAGAQAISITFDNGFKFAYSGDCRPSVPFAHIGKGSDVLVHEATFDDDLEGDALAKKHCTTGEALGVAAKMEAKNVILTHFSQRYQKLPVMENVKLPALAEGSVTSEAEDWSSSLNELGETEAASDAPDSICVREGGTPSEFAGIDTPVLPMPEDMNISVAFDYMRIRVSQIKHMQKFTPAFAALFEAEQTKSIGKEVTPQERSEMVNRAKRSKKPQRSTDIDEDGTQ